MSVIIVPTGARVVISPAPWKDAKALKKAIQKELAASGSKLSLDSDVGHLVSAIMLVDSSDAVDTALQACLVRCLYNDEKITEETFNDVSARKDYYDIVVACVKENLGPLAESLFLKSPKAKVLSMVRNEPGDTPK